MTSPVLICRATSRPQANRPRNSSFPLVSTITFVYRQWSGIAYCMHRCRLRVRIVEMNETRDRTASRKECVRYSRVQQASTDCSGYNWHKQASTAGSRVLSQMAKVAKKSSLVIHTVDTPQTAIVCPHRVSAHPYHNPGTVHTRARP